MSKGGADEEGCRRRPAALDPMATARVVGEIQAEGLRAAGALVDRLVHLVDGPDRVDEHAPDVASPTPNSPADAQAATEAWFTMWSELFERTTLALGSFSPTTDEAEGTEAVESAVSLKVDGRRGGGANGVVLSADPGGAVATEVWIHNGTAEDLHSLTPICSPLVGPDGSLLRASVEVDPPTIELLPRRSSRGLLLTVRVATNAHAGPHRGTLQVTGAPELWLPVEVVVEVPA